MEHLGYLNQMYFNKEILLMFSFMNACEIEILYL